MDGKTSRDREHVGGQQSGSKPDSGKTENSWRRLFGGKKEAAGLEFPKPEKRGLREGLMDRLRGNDKDHPIHQKRSDQVDRQQHPIHDMRAMRTAQAQQEERTRQMAAEVDRMVQAMGNQSARPGSEERGPQG